MNTTAVSRYTAMRLKQWLRVASASGFAVTLLYSVLSVFPIIEVPSWQTFALKITTVIVLANLIGVGIYFGGRSRARHSMRPG